MTRRALIALLAAAALAPPAPAQEDADAARDAALGGTVVAVRAVRAQTVLAAHDLRLEPGSTPGALTSIEDAVGMETRRSLFPNRPVMAGEVGPPAVVERNDLVTLRYENGPLTIVTDGRALGRGGVGERVRALNLDSRLTVTGRIAGPGLVEVR